MKPITHTFNQPDHSYIHNLIIYALNQANHSWTISHNNIVGHTCNKIVITTKEKGWYCQRVHIVKAVVRKSNSLNMFTIAQVQRQSQKPMRAKINPLVYIPLLVAQLEVSCSIRGCRGGHGDNGGHKIMAQQKQTTIQQHKGRGTRQQGGAQDNKGGA